MVLDLKLYNDDIDEQWSVPFDVIFRLIIYSAFVAVLMMMAALIIKLLATLVGDDDVGSSIEQVSENNSLLPKEETSYTYGYGTCDLEDLEYGSNNCSTSSSEDLYDKKICVICYDGERSCFFIPCGHCITCHNCAKRIFEEETKTCPICRRSIQKVSKLFMS